MSVFSANINHRSFHWQINILCFVLGLVLACAFFTANQIARQGTISPRAGFVYGNSGLAPDKTKDFEKEIQQLQAEKTALSDKVHSGAALNQELKETKFLAGLTEVAGPGVQVTLTDSQKKPLLPSSQFQLNSLIHDSDITSVINELKAAGAEAISIGDGKNDQRVIAMTAIRCVGPVVQVDGRPLSPPYVIKAIGDQDAMYGGLNLPSGVLDGLRQFDPNMVHIEKIAKLRLPAYTGITHPRFAHALDTSPDRSKENR